MEAGQCLILFDGLDEAPDQRKREKISFLVTRLLSSYPECRLVLTSRPVALRDIPPGFAMTGIAPLRESDMETFLLKWSSALYPDAPEKSKRHQQELSRALRAKPDIRRLARIIGHAYCSGCSSLE
ncbi:MAG: NACHT domain-containing protein [bacterium]